MNNTPKNFYVLYPKDKKIKDTLNAIKILSDNSQRTAAHITVRGPYSKKLTKSTPLSKLTCADFLLEYDQ
jgi:uncharacterized radical SAM superfamily protein